MIATDLGRPIEGSQFDCFWHGDFQPSAADASLRGLDASTKAASTTHRGYILAVSPVAPKVDPETNQRGLKLMRRISLLLSFCLFTALFFSASAQASGGTVMGWGSNVDGEVGTGEVSKTGCKCIESPVLLPGLSGVSQTAGGNTYSLALSADGTVKGWGNNFVGQLGFETKSYENPTPTAVPGLTGVIEIAAGYQGASYALLSNGTVMAWGENSFGQLGIGSTGPEECVFAIPCSTHPVLVPGLSNVVAISTGGKTTFALLADGTVVGWGEADIGQLGDGTGIGSGCGCSDHPVPIPGISNALAISAGGSWAMALLSDHSVVAWGQNSNGQLAIGDSTTYNPGCECLPPTRTLLTGVKSIAAGEVHGVAVLLDGSVKTWGENLYGQLGDGSALTTGCACLPTPTTILAGTGAQTASANIFDGMALLNDGTLRGWGRNYYGEIGDGTTQQRLSPVPTAVSGASAVNLRNDGGSAIIGPSQTLSVALAGAGTGTVQGGNGEITCPTICTAKYPQGRVAILSATSTAGGFAGFSGPCAGTGTCETKIEADQTLTATFGVPKGTKITKSKISSPKKKATFSFSAPGAITGYQCLLLKPRPHHKARASKKHKKPKFAQCKGPKAYNNLKPGRYTFKVRALDILGADGKPAKRVFKVSAPKAKVTG